MLSNGLDASKNAVRGALAKAFRLPLGQAGCDAAGRGELNSMRSHEQQMRYQLHPRPAGKRRPHAPVVQAERFHSAGRNSRFLQVTVSQSRHGRNNADIAAHHINRDGINGVAKERGVADNHCEVQVQSKSQ
jgi:hypothetical protein